MRIFKANCTTTAAMKYAALTGLAVIVLSSSGCVTGGPAAEDQEPAVDFVVNVDSQEERDFERDLDRRRRFERDLLRDSTSCFFEPRRRLVTEERLITVIQPHARRDYGTDSGC